MSEKESPHITSLRNQDKLQKLAAERLRIANGKLEKYKAEPPAQDIEQVVAAAIAAERKAYEEIYAERIAAAAPGQMIEGHGIFLGTWEPEDKKGSLGKIFNVFVAPEDLPGGPRTYVDTVEYLSGLKNWNGYDGASYADDADLYKALESGAYDGKWIIPTKEILDGDTAECETLMPDNIHTHHRAEGLKDTFNLEASSKNVDGEDNCPAWYWSCTPYNKIRMYNVRVYDGGGSCNIKDSFYYLSCRPIRLELKR